MTVKRTKEDILFSEIVRMRVGDPCYCQHCKIAHPEIHNFDCAHIVTRKYTSGGLRWSFSNATVLCRSCHRMFTDQPHKWGTFLDELLGDGYRDLINDKMNNGMKVTKFMKKELYVYLKECREKVRQERLNGNDGFIDLTDWM